MSKRKRTTRATMLNNAGNPVTVELPKHKFQPGQRVEHVQSGLLGIVTAVTTDTLTWEPFGGKPEPAQPDDLKKYYA